MQVGHVTFTEELGGYGEWVDGDLIAFVVAEHLLSLQHKYYAELEQRASLYNLKNLCCPTDPLEKKLNLSGVGSASDEALLFAD